LSDVAAFAQGRVGTTLRAKYRLDALIGVGGMAAVYRATHRVGNRVAVKVLHPHLSVSADLRTRFLREGYVANKVEHRGAVRVLDDDTADDGSVFIAMELLSGETLEARRERHGGKLPLQEVLQVSQQLLSVLEAAHSKGIVHRDIKPDNLFLTDDGVLKVLDFGIARLREGTDLDSATQTGSTLGTPAFMPPEQALGRSSLMDAKTDLWAVGATMFTLLSGHFVHQAETAQEMLVRSASQRARSIASIAPEVSSTVAAVIDRALAFEMSERWATAGAMRDALDSAYLALYGRPIAGSVGPRPSTSSVAFAETALSEPIGPAVNAVAPPQIVSARSLPSPGQSTPRVSAMPPLARLSTTAGLSGVSSGALRDRGLKGRGRRPVMLSLIGVAALAGIGVAGSTLSRSMRAPAPARAAVTISESAAALPSVSATIVPALELEKSATTPAKRSAPAPANPPTPAANAVRKSAMDAGGVAPFRDAVPQAAPPAVHPSAADSLGLSRDNPFR
jgi:eukaryotic-like serine/threonine-protein kinase